MVWRTINNSAYEFKTAGDSVKGRLSNIRDGKFGRIYILELPSGEQITIYGCKVLDQQLPKYLDKYICITFLGTKEGKQGTAYKDFQIRVWDTVDAPAPDEFNNNFLV